MKFPLLSFLLFISWLSYGQKHHSDIKIVVHPDPGATYTAYPELILVIDTTEYRLDSISLKMIDSNWIKRIEVIKSVEYKNIYGNKDGVVFIYPKKRKRKKITELLNEMN